MIELEFMLGLNKGKSFRPSAERISIGRSRDNSLALKNPHVSSRHGLILKEGIDLSLSGPGSMNGTLVRRKGNTSPLCGDTQLNRCSWTDARPLGAVPNVVEMRGHTARKKRLCQRLPDNHRHLFDRRYSADRQISGR